MSSKKKSKAKTKKVQFADVSNNPYAVPLLPFGVQSEVALLAFTDEGPLVKMGDGLVYHLDSEEEKPISIFDYPKKLKEAWCDLVGIKLKDLPQYADEALAVERIASAKALLKENGYQVSEPLL